MNKLILSLIVLVFSANVSFADTFKVAYSCYDIRSKQWMYNVVGVITDRREDVTFSVDLGNNTGWKEVDDVAFEPIADSNGEQIVTVFVGLINPTEHIQSVLITVTAHPKYKEVSHYMARLVDGQMMRGTTRCQARIEPVESY